MVTTRAQGFVKPPFPKPPIPLNNADSNGCGNGWDALELGVGRQDLESAAGRLWIEEGERREGMIAEIAPLMPVHKTYSFLVPDQIQESLQVGQRVQVPVGRKGRLVTGFVVGMDHGRWDATLRPIHSLLDSQSYLSSDLVHLGREIAEHYACPLGLALKAMTPEAVRREAGTRRVRYAQVAGDIHVMMAAVSRIGARQRAILDFLSHSKAPVAVADVLEHTGASSSSLSSAIKRGWVSITERKELVTDDDSDRPARQDDFELNKEQAEAFTHCHQALADHRFSVTLLFGVSGSGKTEVYIHTIREALNEGRQAILLVPEIVLTTQLVGRIAARFDNVAVQHSGLTDVQRSVLWRQVAAGDRPVVIGTRSAVFAPCPKLGLIVVDEEQDSSYKNLQAPRFHVRDVAIMRARQEGVPVLLGSATPSLEVWHRSGHHRDYARLSLTRRVGDRDLPKVYVVDMRDEYAELKRQVSISRTMGRMLTETLDRGQQAIILINRRGFANRIFCPNCRSRIQCPKCSANLVAHTSTGKSICHYCSHRIDTPTVCPNIGCGEKLVQTGMGTQRLETLIRSRWPDARLARVDSDTMNRREKYQQLVDDFSAGSIDMLVGTQIIAKGLDFPMVSFVGVIDADPGAIACDFRAHERLFQLITQVAGRAGRADVPGRVVVQSTMPDLPALQCALNHDYERFAAQELGARRRVRWPPFGRLVRMVIAHAREETVRAEAEGLYSRIEKAIDSLSLADTEILGPNPCVILRMRGKYRYELIVRTAGAMELRRLMRHLNESGALRTKAQTMVVDVDPVEMA